MALKVYDTLVPQGDYPVAKAEDVLMPDGTRLDKLKIPEPVTDYVKSVNGKTPDENGNVVVQIPEQKKELPQVTDDDNGKFLMVVNGAWVAMDATELLTAIVKDLFVEISPEDYELLEATGTVDRSKFYCFVSEVDT